MKIGFDARCLEEARISGVGEYTLELLKNILNKDNTNRYVIFSNSFKQKSGQHFDWLKNYPNVELKRFSFPNKILNFCLWYFNYPKLDRFIGGVDIFIFPNINFFAISHNLLFIITFHDLSFERIPGFYPLKTRLWHKYFVNPRKIARSAKKIIAVSESTKRDLAEIYQISEKKINVVYHGIDQDFKIIDRNNPRLFEVQKKYKLPYSFILYLGNIESRKNIGSILSAYKTLTSRQPELAKYKLVLAGNISPAHRELVSKDNMIVCGYIERGDRPYVYNLASLFVYPSFFEGFGLPILEAMACGTPVITSHNSSAPEVAGGAAILIDPNRPNQLVDAMKNILTDESFYDKVRERGLVQAKKFSWKKCAKDTLRTMGYTKS